MQILQFNMMACDCVCVLMQVLQFDMWGVKPYTDLDWTALRARIAK